MQKHVCKIAKKPFIEWLLDLVTSGVILVLLAASKFFRLITKQYLYGRTNIGVS